MHAPLGFEPGGEGTALRDTDVFGDDGVFRGWVATEASLHGRHTGGALVAASYRVGLRTSAICQIGMSREISGADR